MAMQNEILNSYTVKHLIGKGGMADVWYAENNLGKPAAIKIMHESFIGNEQVANRFETEAKVMLRLNHPNIRSVYDFGMFRNRPFIVMEYLEGKDLSHFVNNSQSTSNNNMQKWWQQCVSALEYTHKQSIIHRDIKPSNLFLLNNGDIKILDFGIAKVFQDASLTSTGQVMGTPLYMSPEQVLNTKTVTAKTDTYSLAVTFLHLLKGRVPFTKTSSDYSIQSQIVHGEIDFSGVSETWLSTLKPCLITDDSNRYSAADCVGALSSRQQDSGVFTKREVKDGEKGTSTTWLMMAGILIIALLGYFLYEKYKTNTENKVSNEQVSPSNNENTNKPAGPSPVTTTIANQNQIEQNPPVTGNDQQEPHSYILADGELVFVTDFYMIVTGAYLYRSDAAKEVQRLRAMGYSNAGYLWIPDFPSLSGKQNYATFLGPYNSKNECLKELQHLPRNQKFWYAKKVSMAPMAQGEIRVY